MGKSINANALRDLMSSQGGGRQISIPADGVLTPSAKDLAKELGLDICRGDVQVTSYASNPEPTAMAGKKKNTTASVAVATAPATSVSVNPASAGVCNDATLVEMVKQVVGQLVKPACPNPHAVHFSADKMVHVPFDQAPPGQKITMTDVITSRDANLGAGFMRYDHSQLNWHLTYDEINYVVDGDYVLKVGDQTFYGKPGDVLYIPADSHVTFASPTSCTVFYVVYPSNWDELCD